MFVKILLCCFLLIVLGGGLFVDGAPYSQIMTVPTSSPKEVLFTNIEKIPPDSSYPEITENLIPFSAGIELYASADKSTSSNTMSQKPITESPGSTESSVEPTINASVQRIADPNTNVTVSDAEITNPVEANSTTSSPPSTPKPKVRPDTHKEIDDKCPELDSIKDLDSLTQDDFTSLLTDSCRYDRLVKPITKEHLDVHLQIDLTHIESADHLQLKAHILIQLLYVDQRLNYSTISPKRGNILGEEILRNKIWVPHVVIQNERDTVLMGMNKKDVFVEISPAGEVTYSYRITTTFYCWMNLQKFPFDHQICEIRWVSWAYNISNLRLSWEGGKPFIVAPNLHLTEYVLEEKWCETSVVPPAFDRGGLAGNYSAAIFKFKLRREVGYYIMDYFLPSILLVCMSWVTFWLQADASAPRVTLGASTMLSFITLNGGLSKNLPKVSYIKASEIWFLGCVSFIFFSLAEFAFVNVIWRRRKKVELKKQNSKHILKGALTPSLARKQLRKAESSHSLYKTRSCSSLDRENAKNTQMNYLTVHIMKNTCVWFIEGLRKFDHVSHLYRNLAWLCVQNLFKYSILTFTHRIIVTSSPQYLSCKLVQGRLCIIFMFVTVTP
ncbi:unnamed protein product [Acanthoscelides obtectus]|uniref:pH-sensitive chloride channel 2 n=1 Tax=Acanthoscelides obtectus TaxID=200917 RepID=A0A9P0NUC8_ACAOB|nr:unnamed protein product [Acanthoscelides obtectus]CAK1662183.1 Gamma-aminobutyric acid receptor subunit beta-3 [Acanthoscelides obtectus]